MMGRLRGGVAAGSVGIAAVFAGMVGTSTVATALIGSMSIPEMLKLGYKKTMAVGPICAGGALGILIPPSVIMIIYGVEAQESIGHLFIGGILPGILLTCMFVAYIIIRGYFAPNDAPASQERYTWREKITSLKGVILPACLIALVLGFIYLGIATPTESSAVGAVGAMVCVLAAGKFNRTNIMNAIVATLRMSGLILWIVIGAACFNRIVGITGITQWLTGAISTLDINAWAILISMQLVFLIMGMIMDPAGIILITTPIFIPIIKQIGFDTLWFGILFTINMEMSYITPPFGFNLFVIRAITPSNVTTGDIYKSVIPYVCIQILCLAIVMIFPEIALWLPSTMGAK
jgi:tripartite ATP-independent transporter DctM subunit